MAVFKHDDERKSSANAREGSRGGEGGTGWLANPNFGPFFLKSIEFFWLINKLNLQII